MTTGGRMKFRRKELDIPVEDVASALGVSVATVYRYENGDIEKVPGAVLDPLAKVLKTTPAYLMGWGEEGPAPNAGDGPSSDEAIEIYSSLSESQREKARDFLRYLKAQEDTR